MPAIVEFPSVVQEVVEQRGAAFANAPERVHFAEYLTGLLVAERKNVCGINREFAVTTDQSCLNRWLTAVAWDEKQLNRDRLAWLQQEPSTRYSAHGVIAKETCQERQAEFKDHNELVRELVDWVVDWVVAEEIPGDFTFDSYFTHAANLNPIHRHQRGYVGDLKFNRKILWQGRTLKAEELAALIPPEARKPVEVDGKVQWYFTKSIRLPEVDHPVRIVILWAEQDAEQARKILVTNRTPWQVSRILRVYRRRWRGTECFHRDGKQHLGLGDCQLRKGQGQTRHLYMVFLAHSALMRQLRQSRACEWARERLLTIGEACRAVARQTLSQALTWALERAQEGWSCQRIKTQLALP